MVSLAVMMLTMLPFTVQEEECTLSRLYGCLESLQWLGNNLETVTTRGELIKVCRQLQSGVQCLDRHLFVCFTSDQRKLFDDVVATARQFLSGLCVNGPLQDAYLRYSPCIENASISHGSCMTQELVRFPDMDNKESAAAGLRNTCCAFKDFILCKYTLVNEYCGSEAANFLHHHLDRISRPLLLQHCASFTYRQGTCAANSSATSECFVTIFLFVAMYIGQFFFIIFQLTQV